MDVVAVEPPLPAELIEELVTFWEAIFQTPYGDYRPALAGAEATSNHDIIYLVRAGDEVVGTSHLTTSRAVPSLGGLGEVATKPDARGQGIATELCARARDDFRAQGGQALFLGTVNPAAARVYYRLGWRKLAGANVMACIAGSDSPEAFLLDYFGDQSQAAVVGATVAERIRMIPLLVAPHDWQVLDANVGMFSTRYVVQTSCMTLYPRYSALGQSDRGAWFGAHTALGRVVGLASARLDRASRCQVDGFTHQRWSDVWDDLIQAAMRWGTSQGASVCWAAVSVEDEDKQALFEALGFRQVGTDGSFDLDGRSVAAVRLEKVGHS